MITLHFTIQNQVPFTKNTRNSHLASFKDFISAAQTADRSCDSLVIQTPQRLSRLAHKLNSFARKIFLEILALPRSFFSYLKLQARVHQYHLSNLSQTRFLSTAGSYPVHWRKKWENISARELIHAVVLLLIISVIQLCICISILYRYLVFGLRQKWWCKRINSLLSSIIRELNLYLVFLYFYTVLIIWYLTGNKNEAVKE